MNRYRSVSARSGAPLAAVHGDSEGQLRYHRRVAELLPADPNPRDTRALFRRAEVLEATGERDEARRLCLEVASFNPLLDLEHAFVRRSAFVAGARLP